MHLPAATDWCDPVSGTRSLEPFFAPPLYARRTDHFRITRERDGSRIPHHGSRIPHNGSRLVFTFSAIVLATRTHADASRHRELEEALPDGLVDRSCARRRVPDDRSGRVRGAPGYVWFRQIDLAQSDRWARQANRRVTADLRPRPGADVQCGAEPSPAAERRYHFPVVQPGADDDCPREHYAGDDVCRRGACGTRRVCGKPARVRGTR